MSADILERLEELAWLASRSDGTAVVTFDNLREAAAEIGRLRGEVEALRQCGVKYLGWLGVKDAENGLRKDMADPEMVDRPAPAMPNGVGAADVHLAAEMLTWGREEGLTVKQEAEVAAHAEKLFRLLRAADNRDAAGVAEEYDEGPTWTHDGKRISAVFSGDGKVGLVITANPGAVNGRIEFIGAPVPIPITPAAVPAGEAVASDDARRHAASLRGISSHIRACPPYEKLRGDADCIDAAADFIMRTPQPADGEAVALWISRHWREDLGRDSVVSVVNREDPAHTLRIYVSTTPPAPVQAAPQEWCPFCGGTGGHWEGCRAPVDTSTHPAAGDKVRELVVEWRNRRNVGDFNYTPDHPALIAIRECADELEAALQHRGDSRGGEAS